MDDVTGLIRQVLVTASEFDGAEVHTSNSDVEKTFDQLRHTDQISALIARGATNEEAWLIARELSGIYLFLEVPGTDETVEAPMNKAGVQGGVLTPDTWNRVMEDALEVTVQEWEEEGLG